MCMCLKILNMEIQASITFDQIMLNKMFNFLAFGYFKMIKYEKAFKLLSFFITKIQKCLIFYINENKFSNNILDIDFDHKKFTVQFSSFWALDLCSF